MEPSDQIAGATEYTSRQFRSLDEGFTRTRPRYRQLYTDNDDASPDTTGHHGAARSASSFGASAGDHAPYQSLPRFASFPSRPGNYDHDPRPVHKSRSCSNVPELQRIIEHMYRNYRQCRECHSADIVQVKDKHDSILLVWCRNCSHGFGVDDTVEPEVLLELYHQGCIEVAVGCCSNTDPDEFDIVGYNGVSLTVKCRMCQRVSPMGGEDARSDPDAAPNDSGALVCACGNRDQEDMTVCLFENEVRCVTCNLCEQYIDFPEIVSCESTIPDDHDPSDFVSCKCARGKNNIKVIKDDSGAPEIIACTNCNWSYLPKDPPRKKTQQCRPSASQGSSKQTWSSWFRSAATGWVPYLVQGVRAYQDSKNDLKVKYRQVHRLSELSRGDHIMWDRREGYGHHAIVEYVHTHDISVVHYNGPSPRSHAYKIKGKIVSEELNPFAREHGRLFVVDYPNPLPADTVIQNAYSKLGEVEYSLVSNNCEHFATWCKTGLFISSQVTKVAELMKKYGQACYDFTKGDTSGSKSMQALDNYVPGLGKLASTLPLKAKGFARYGAIILMAANEIRSCCEDIKNATDDRREGNLSRDAYVEFVVSRVCQSVGGLGGMAIGLRLPLPVLASMAAGTLGGLIGAYVGKQIGPLIIRTYEELGDRFGMKQLMA